MRTAFIDQLIKEARQNPNIFLIVGDLGYNVIEPFAKEFPDRFLNAGIAEQNMAGVAAGLSMCGYNVYIYSIGNFPTLRCIEQIRNDVAYHKANVKIVAVGAGFAYADLGATHHATEALGIMRAIPNMVVSSPSDPAEARAITSISSTYNGPMYIQLGKAGEKNIHPTVQDLKIGDIIKFRVSGKNKALFLTGSIAAEVLTDDKALEYDIYTVPFIKPLNRTQMQSIASTHSEITIIEEHQLSTGVGSAITEVLNDLYADEKLSIYPRIHRIGIADCFTEVSGSQNFLRKINALHL